jgi:hypothetical protein
VGMETDRRIGSMPHYLSGSCFDERRLLMGSEVGKKTVFITLLLAVFFVVLSGCGGGGDSPPAETPPPVKSADGIWQGSAVDDSGTCQLYMMTSNGEMAAFSNDCQRIYKGSYSVNGNDLSGQVEVYKIGGAKEGSITLSGNFSEKSNMSGSYSSNGSQGTFDLAYNQLSDRPSSLELTGGAWAFNGPDGFTADVVIDNQGEISGSNSYGCIFTGIISLTDTNMNIYSIDFDVSQCVAHGGVYDHDGSYDGLAVLGTDSTTNRDSLIVVSASSDNSLLYPIARQ